MQTIPADARLGRTKSKQTIGYRVLNLDCLLFSPFTTERVIESGIAGHYIAVGGVVAPDEGGYIIWGTVNEDIAQATIEPAPADVTEGLLSGIAKRLDALLTSIKAAMPVIPPFPAIPAPIVNTTEFEERITTLRTYLFELTTNSNEQHAGRVSELQAQIDSVVDATNRIELLTDAVRKTEALSELYTRMSALFGNPAPVVIHETDPRIANTLETVRADIQEIVNDKTEAAAARARRAKVANTLNRLIDRRKSHGNGKTD